MNEDNKLFCDFMDFTYCEPGLCSIPEDYSDLHHDLYYDGESLTSCLFHSDWKWLMAVLEKIHREYNVSYLLAPCLGNKYYCHLESERYDRIKYSKSTEADNLLEATYNSIIEFIKWWNENVRNINSKK